MQLLAGLSELWAAVLENRRAGPVGLAPAGGPSNSREQDSGSSIGGSFPWLVLITEQPLPLQEFKHAGVFPGF